MWKTGDAAALRCHLLDSYYTPISHRVPLTMLSSGEVKEKRMGKVRRGEWERRWRRKRRKTDWLDVFQSLFKNFLCLGSIGVITL